MTGVNTGDAFGRIYGVGVGPGDPELITVKAARILAKTPVIAWPAPLDGESLARTIAAPHFNGPKQEIPIRMPMVSDRFPASQIYDQAAEEILSVTGDGLDVAVLCEGDPFFYGSFMYLFDRLAEHRQIDVIPGVSSLTASAAATGFPLSSRNDALAILPSPREEADLRSQLDGVEGAVFIKIGRHLPKIRRLLKSTGLDKDAVYIQHATMSEQQVYALSEVPEDHNAPYFSMILAHRRGRAQSLDGNQERSG